MNDLNIGFSRRIIMRYSLFLLLLISLLLAIPIQLTAPQNTGDIPQALQAFREERGGQVHVKWQEERARIKTLREMCQTHTAEQLVKRLSHSSRNIKSFLPCPMGLQKF